MPTVFITGGTGLVGSYIIRHLLGKNYQIKALKRQNSNFEFIQDIAEKVQWIDGDILDVGFLEEATKKVDYIIHAAAVVSFHKEDRAMMYKVNVGGTANVVNVCLKNKNKKLCFVSSVAAIGRHKNRQTYNENTRWENSKLNSHYSKTKHFAELEVWRGIAEGLSAVIVNPSVILGFSDWYRSSTQVFKYVWDEKKYYSEGLVNYVDVRDVAEVIVKLLVSDIEGERFILNADTITYKTLFETIAKYLNKQAPTKKVTPFLSKIAWRVLAISSLFTGKKPLVTRETANTSQNSFIYENSKIIDNLNFKFKNLEESVEWVCKQLVEKHG